MYNVYNLYNTRLKYIAQYIHKRVVRNVECILYNVYNLYTRLKYIAQYMHNRVVRNI